MSAKAKNQEQPAEETSKKSTKGEGRQAARAAAKKDVKKKSDKKPEKAGKKPNIFKRFVNYLKAVRVELKRVTWPTPREVRNSTITVLVALVFFGVLIYLVDTGIAPVLNAYSQLAG